MTEINGTMKKLPFSFLTRVGGENRSVCMCYTRAAKLLMCGKILLFITSPTSQGKTMSKIIVATTTQNSVLPHIMAIINTKN